MWKLHKVLSALSNPLFESLREGLLIGMRMKTPLLKTVTSIRRVCELGLLSAEPELYILHGNKVLLRSDPTFMPKVNSAFHRAQDLCFPSKATKEEEMGHPQC